jgi:small-conductance mechanosensitive channel
MWFFCFVVPVMALAQEPKTDAEGVAQQQSEENMAPVIVDGRELFKVRGVSAYPATRRAAEVAARIEALAADPTTDPKALRLVVESNRTDIYSGETQILAIFDEDAAIEGISRQLLVVAIKSKVEEAITNYRSDRTPRHLIFSGLYALGATLLLILVVYASRRLFGWLERVAERRYKKKLEALKIQSLQLVHSDQLWLALMSFVKVVKVLLWLVLLYLYVNLVMGFFPWTRFLADNLLSVFLDPLRVIAVGLVNSLPNVVFLVILFFVTRYILKVLRLLFVSIQQGSIKFTSFDPEWAFPTYRLVRILVIAFALVVAYPYIPGSSSEAFKGISLFMGVIFSLGSSSVISNVVAGYTMTYRRAFKVGDRIKVDDMLGDVAEIRLLVTHLRSIKNEEIVIPNSVILNSHVINYSTLAKQQGLILHTTVGIGYETPWRQVHAMLLMAAERTEGFLKEPSPFVLQKVLGDFCVNYELNVYCDNVKSSAQLYTVLHQNILDVFNEYDVQIMTPAYEGDTPEPKVVPKDQWFAAPAQAPQSSGGTK